jgi:hypothetical protein
VEKIREFVKIKEEEFNPPTIIKWRQTTNVGGKVKKPKRVITNKEEDFS